MTSTRVEHVKNGAESKRRVVAAVRNNLTMAGVCGLIVGSASISHAQPVSTDWTTISASRADGVLGDATVILTSSPASLDAANTILDGTSSLFADPLFFPQFASSDQIGFLGRQDPVTYTLSFDRPICQPILHFVSLASTLTFQGINPVKLSGQSTLMVSGNTVSGVVFGPPPTPYNDANGSVLLPGTYTEIRFTAQWLPGTDGIRLQLAAYNLRMSQHPVSGIACPEGSRVFSAQAEGIGPFTYQWQIQTSPPPNETWQTLGSDPGSFPCPSGGTGTAFATPLNSPTVSIGVSGCAAAPGAVWPIRCIVTNACGSVTSNAGTLTITNPYANCDNSTTAPILGAADFSCFLAKFRAGDAYANCDNSTTPPVLGAADFSCFLAKFRAGCP